MGRRFSFGMCECPFCFKQIARNMMDYHIHNKCDKAKQAKMHTRLRTLRSVGVHELNTETSKESGRWDEYIAHLKTLPITELKNLSEVMASGRVEEFKSYMENEG